MSKNAESLFKDKICSHLKVFGVVTKYVPMQGYSTQGTPDIHFHGRLFCGWLEFKGVKTRITSLQKSIIHRFNLILPASAFVIRDGGEGSLHLIQNENGKTLATFKNGKNLLDQLYLLRQQSLLGEVFF